MKRTILIVDDDPTNRYMLRSLLEGHGFQVAEAPGGEQALAIARRGVPDAVVTDLLMPGMDGYSLCRAWVGDPVLSSKPFLVYSATYTETKDRQLALDLGAVAFLAKPMEPDELVAAVQAALDRAEGGHVPIPAVQADEFIERYASRLQAKLIGKIEQLASTQQAFVDYVTRSEAILDAAADAIISIDREFRIRSWNYSAEKLLGYSEAEALGQPFAMLIPDDQKHQTLLDFEAADRNRTVRRKESQWLHKDGRLLEVAVATTLLGQPIGFVAVVTDMSAARREAAQKKKLEDQLELAQRLESVGRLAGGVAHDFNNLLTVILFHANVIETELGSAAALGEDARWIREAAERATTLTRQLLAFSRRQTIKPEVLNLNETVRSMEKMLRRLIGEDIDLRVGLAADLASVEADVSQVEQVILNIAVNARDAMPEGGRLVIETSNTEVDEAEAARRPPMRAGRYVMMTFADTGTGMDDNTRTHAFEPFFTTKEFGKGTGLGLATVYGIVKQSNGFIWLDSEPGAGTTLRVFLPRMDRPTTSRRLETGERADRRGAGETVLVVEDDDMVRKLARRILERAGYRVLEAADGGEALLVAESSNDRIDLLLTDVIMPSINGRELARRLLASRPTMKVAFTSGYTDDVIARHGVLDPGVSLVEKPFSAHSLTRVVRDVLDGLRPGGIGGR